MKCIALFRWFKSEKLRALPPSPRLARRITSRALAEWFRFLFGKPNSRSVKQRTVYSTDALRDLTVGEKARDRDGLIDLAEAVQATLPGVVSDVRAMFELVYVDGFSVAEVARSAGIPWTTLHDQFSRVRDAIRESLGFEVSDRDGPPLGAKS